MPLRVRRRKGTSFFWLVGTIEGRRVRESTGTDNPEHAEIKRAAREAELFKAAIAGVRPTVPFAKAAASYLKAEKPGFTQRQVVAKLITALGTKPTRDIDQMACDRARDALCNDEVSPGTVVRNVVSPLTSILRHASRRGWCDWPHLEWPDVPKAGFNYLLPAQAEALIAEASPNIACIITFMLCTGVRMGEAMQLCWEDVDLIGRRAILWEGTTKTDKRRVVSLNSRAVTTLGNLPGREGRVFRRIDGEPYTLREGTGGHIRTGWNSACCRAGLPGTKRERLGQRRGAGRFFTPDHTPHDCRHTYATWHYAVNKDLLLLVRDVGWHSSAMAERYAHVMPEGHRAAILAFWGEADPIQTQRPELRVVNN